MSRHRAERLLLASALILATTSANANIGLPLVAVFLPPLWLALVPIILIEAAIISRLTPSPFLRALAAASLANIVSTIIGVPLFWMLLATAELVCCGTALGLGTPLTKLYAVTVQAPWLIPYESEFSWMIPAALLTMGALCAGMSILVEAPIVTRMLHGDRRSTWRAAIIANLASYVALGTCGWLAVEMGAKLDSLNRLFAPVSEVLMIGVFSIATLIAGGGRHAF